MQRSLRAQRSKGFRVKHLLAFVLCALSAACNSCTPEPAPITPDPVPFPPEPYDAAPDPIPVGDAAPPSTPSEAACQNLHRLGCDEAESVKACVDVTNHAISAHLTTVNLQCLSTATTRAQVRACKFVNCGGSP